MFAPAMVEKWQAIENGRQPLQKGRMRISKKSFDLL
jgi:hypothetical protein